MKTAITILTICLLTITGTQNAQAQTKKETVKWIKEKLEKYIQNSEEITVSPCHIKWNKGNGNGTAYWIYSFNPSSAGGWSFYENPGDVSGYFVKAEASTIKVYYSYHDSYSKSNAFFILDGEPRLAERMAKALATFCDEGKNETF